VNLALLLRGRLPHASAHDGGVTFGQAGKEDAVAREINDEAERLLRAAVSSSDEEAQRNGAIALAVLLSERGRATEADAVSRSGMTTSEPPDEMTNSHREDRRGDEEP
jgi:hypothetical protein